MTIGLIHDASTETPDEALRAVMPFILCPVCTTHDGCQTPDGWEYKNGYVHTSRAARAWSALAAMSSVGVRFSRCKECDKPIIESTKKKGRASVYCCKECRWAHERPNP